jgi:hypothetical protein
MVEWRRDAMMCGSSCRARRSVTWLARALVPTRRHLRPLLPTYTDRVNDLIKSKGVGSADAARASRKTPAKQIAEEVQWPPAEGVPDLAFDGLVTAKRRKQAPDGTECGRARARLVADEVGADDGDSGTALAA